MAIIKAGNRWLNPLFFIHGEKSHAAGEARIDYVVYPGLQLHATGTDADRLARQLDLQVIRDRRRSRPVPPPPPSTPTPGPSGYEGRGEAGDCLGAGGKKEDGQQAAQA